MIKFNEILTIDCNKEFEDKALEIFKFQAYNNAIYNEYIFLRKIDIEKVKSIKEIPFLPIGFFKKFKITSSDKHPDEVFASSGTTDNTASLHYVVDASVYKKSLKRCFEYFYGTPKNYCFLALLPHYLERQGSSLVYMVNELMRLSNHPENGFYLNNFNALKEKIEYLDNMNVQTVIFGVSFALLDFARKFKLNLKNAIIMETGGMKGRQKEITRNELHNELKKGLGTKKIHSEYSMTELLSQAYSKGNGIFYTPPWMKILIRDIYDPFSYVEAGKNGGINIIDLANVYSVSFIETRDIGKLTKTGGFEVLGRFDESDIRGCNLLVIN